MFWIPICAIVFAVWLVSRVFNGVKTANSNKREAAHADVVREFEVKTALGREREYEINKRLDHNFEEQYRVIRDFMGGDIEEQDIRPFALSTLKPAYRILAAQRGCVWSGYDTWTGTTPPMQNSQMNPPWKIFELTERMFLMVEDEMKKHGVQTKIMADYTENRFESVRDHVARCGYGKLDGKVHFKWIQYTSQWESIT